jgi:hypothetical protein
MPLQPGLQQQMGAICRLAGRLQGRLLVLVQLL